MLLFLPSPILSDLGERPCRFYSGVFFFLALTASEVKIGSRRRQQMFIPGLSTHPYLAATLTAVKGAGFTVHIAPSSLIFRVFGSICA